nr:hypothetical protein [Tanacetum cinerariifolium]
MTAGMSRQYISGLSGTLGKQRVIVCYNCKGKGHMLKQCTKPKRKREKAWFKDKVLLVQAQANGQVLHEEELEFLADPGIASSQNLIDIFVILINLGLPYGVFVWFLKVEQDKHAENNVCTFSKVTFCSELRCIELSSSELRSFSKLQSTASLRDRPPMLATGRYAQWRSWFLRYIDTRPNGDALRECILEGPYTHSTVVECRKQKRVKDSTYHKEKILLCKQAEQGVSLQAEHVDWLEDTDDEIDE